MGGGDAAVCADGYGLMVHTDILNAPTDGSCYGDKGRCDINALNRCRMLDAECKYTESLGVTAGVRKTASYQRVDGTAAPTPRRRLSNGRFLTSADAAIRLGFKYHVEFATDG